MTPVANKKIDHLELHLSKIETRLGKMEVSIDAHAKCAEKVNEELQHLNAWTHSRDGATKALMWVAGISGTVLALGIFLYGMLLKT